MKEYIINEITEMLTHVDVNLLIYIRGIIVALIGKSQD